MFERGDGDGNIVRSIDISGKKEYNYEYEDGRIIRATEADIELNGEIATINPFRYRSYYFDTETEILQYQLIKKIVPSLFENLLSDFTSWYTEFVADNTFQRVFE